MIFLIQSLRILSQSKDEPLLAISFKCSDTRQNELSWLNPSRFYVLGSPHCYSLILFEQYIAHYKSENLRTKSLFPKPKFRKHKNGSDGPGHTAQTSSISSRKSNSQPQPTDFVSLLPRSSTSSCVPCLDQGSNKIPQCAPLTLFKAHQIIFNNHFIQ